MKKNFLYWFCPLIFLLLFKPSMRGQEAISFYPAPSHPISNNVKYWFSNLPPNAVANEACVGDATRRLLLQGAYFNSRPNRLVYKNTSGTFDTLDLSSAVNDYNWVGHNVDFIWIDVPANAASGNWRLERAQGNNPPERAIFSINIRRVEVSAGTLPSIICSSDTIALNATPTSDWQGTGVFWLGTTLGNGVNNSPHIQTPTGGFATANVDKMLVPVLQSMGQSTYFTGNATQQSLYLSYEYTPNLLNNTNIICPAVTSEILVSRVYNNQLDLITFAPVSNLVDSVALNAKIERLLPVGGVISNQFLTFRGNNISASGVFYPSAAGNGVHPIVVTLSNDNKCFAFDTATIEVTNSFNVTGLDSSMCRLDTNVSLTPILPYSRDSSYSFSGGYNFKYVNEYNLLQVQSFTTTGVLLPTVVTPTSVVPGQEIYRFNPSLVTGDSLWISVQYSTRRYTYITTNGVDSFISMVVTPTVRDTKTIYLRGKPIVSFERINSYYCESHNLINLAVYPTGGTGRLEYLNSIAFPNRIITNILSSDSLRYYIDSLHNPTGETGDVQYRYRYKVGLGACEVDTFKLFTILEPIPAAFTARIGNVPATRYCKFRGGSLILEGSPLPTVASSFSGTGITRIGNAYYFRMDSSTSIRNPITYRYVTPAGCESFYTDTIILDPLPYVSLRTSSSDSVCNNTTTRTLIGLPRGGTYSGTLVTANADSATINPQALYPLGGQRYIYSYTDGVGCSNADTLHISIRPAATLAILNQATMLPIDSLYCQQSREFTAALQAITSPTGGTLPIIESVTGRGFIAGTYQYRPSQVGANTYDTLVYTHTNEHGCVSKLNKRVRIESVPQPQVQGLNALYCIDAPPIRMTGFPSSGGVGVFSSVGGGVSRDTFYPAQAGTGRKVIEYSFRSNNGCTGVGYDTIEIKGLPPARFMGLETSYCSDAPADTLVQTQSAFGTGVFSGRGITGDVLDIAYVNATYGPRTHFVYYTFTDTFGCVGRDTQQYYIAPLPSVTLSGVADAYCTNGGIAHFEGNPRAGINTFSQINGLSGGANGIATFDPSRADTTSIIIVSYTYTDTISGCRNTARDTTRVFAPPVVDLQNLPTQVCQQADTILLRGTPAGGVFIGSGTDSLTQSFYPMKVINLGVNYVRYVANMSPMPGVFCTSYDEDTVIVLQRPSARVLMPAANTKFCSDGAPVLFSGENAAGTIRDSVYNGVGVRDSNILVQTGPSSFRTDSIFMFDPVRAGIGTHTIFFTVRDSAGCVDVDTVRYTVIQAPRPTIQGVDSTYCESEVDYIRGVPQTGIFYLNRIDTSTVIGFGEYVPNPNFTNGQFLTAPKRDTIIYQIVNDGLCYGQDTVITRVFPIPQPTFVFVNQNQDTISQACIGRDTVWMRPNLLGGTFSGPGVGYQTNILIPQFAGAGAFPIQYEYIDSTTGCSNTKTNTFNIYNMPQVKFEALGGCGNSLVVMRPDSTLNLTGRMGNQLFDSITTVRWVLGDGTTRLGTSTRTATENYVDTIQYAYAQPGIYYISLSVTNRGYCTDADTLRVVLSPEITPTAIAPYNETFETSNGAWFDESELGNQASDLWTWGVANGRRINTTNDAHNKVWATLDTTYMPGGSWVYSPCFDLTQLTRPMISLDYFSNTDSTRDGAVIEYFDNQTGEWKPLGSVDRGINWYNTSIISGRPGIQDLAPMGWSGQTNQWKNARYKLDMFKRYRNFRFRVAFGADGTQSPGLEGFAFDNVWIGNRTRNVLIEHFANVSAVNMNNVNQYVYNLCYSPDYVRDVVLIQPHLKNPGYDEFYQEADVVNNARSAFYGMEHYPGYAVINGRGDIQNRALSSRLTGDAMERDMLEDPIFSIQIPVAQVSNNQLRIRAVIKANRDLPTPTTYFGHIAVTEDSLEYASNPNVFVQSVLRTMLLTSVGNTMPTTWSVGDSVVLDTVWNFEWGTHNPDNFEVIVFVQQDNSANSSTVYQVATTRDISQFVGTVAPQVTAQAHEAETAVLFPNPAEDYFNVSFEKPLSRDFNWKLVDMHGCEITGGIVQQGTQQLRVDEYDVSSGMYFFVMYTKDFVTRRKVILARP